MCQSRVDWPSHDAAASIPRTQRSRNECRTGIGTAETFRSPSRRPPEYRFVRWNALECARVGHKSGHKLSLGEILWWQLFEMNGGLGRD
jgi:hypothetical protein